MTLLTIEQVVSRYLFNQDAPPEELADENLIRAEDAKGNPIYIDMDEFMTTGAGRFVGVERFLFVRNFLGGHEDSYLGVGEKLPPGKYTTEQLLAAYGKTLDQGELGVSGYYQGIYESDYAERAYIFGSGTYRINSDAVFYVNEDGSREMVDICIEPVDDNFDYEGEGWLADITNYLTKDEIDPSSIGRQVPIVFTGSVVEKQSLTSEDWYSLEILNETAQLAELANRVSMLGNLPYFGGLFGSVLGGLVGDDIITFEDGDGKYVIYDGKSIGNNGVIDPLLLMNLTEFFTYSQVVVIAGGGNDTLYGVGNSGDELYGGAGNDHLDGRLGADHMDGGSGDDTYIADDEGDVIVERTGDGVDLVKSSVTYTLSESVENLELTGSDNIGGTGNALESFMQGNEVGNTLSGAAGNDDMFGGGGDDTLLGMSDNDTLDGGTGNDILNGGEGNDRYEFHSGDGNDQIIDSDGVGSLWLDDVQLTGARKSWPVRDRGAAKMVRSHMF